MPPDTRTLGTDDTIRLLNERAKEKGDSFWVKVFRRRHTGAMPEAVATFSGARVLHIANPETWLPRIAGGGPLFVLSAYHEEDPTVPLGGMLTFSVPIDGCPPKQPAEIDAGLLKQNGWPGPAKLEWPLPEDTRRSAAPPYSVNLMPPAPPAGNSAANNVPVGGQPGAVPAALEAAFAQLERERAKLDFASRELEARGRQAELDAIRRESDMRMKELEMRMASASATPKTDVAQIVVALGTALAPVITKMMESQNELRLAMLKQQETQQLQQQQMFQVMLARPTVDPTIEKALDRVQSLFERQSTSQPPTTQILHSMAEAMGAMTQTTMDLVQTAAELNLGGQREEHPALRAIKEGVKAMNSLFAGYQQALPAKAVGQQPTPQQMYAQQASLPPAAMPQKAPAPAPAPAAAEAAPKYGSTLDTLVALITSKSDPRLVAKTFFDNLGDESLQQALVEVEGEVDELIARRLGGWVLSDPSNAAYLANLRVVVSDMGEKLGVFSADDGDEDEGDDESSEESSEGEAADA